ncbi:MAG: hypothetical protein H6739_37140 [Alphaproteobacteria bacterium]|nr:hypothetical protein [Alphaproteobacteria bacterium]MCB9765460.1 hypothetical protein [Alphaproteobacteria bacterium]
MSTMLPPDAVGDHMYQIALLAEQVEVEAEAVLSSEEELEQLLHIGGVLALVRVLGAEARSLSASILEGRRSEPEEMEE